jgi:hypothetical protein
MRRHWRFVAAGVLRPWRFVGGGAYWHGKFDHGNVLRHRNVDGGDVGLERGVRRRRHRWIRVGHLCRECRQLFGGTCGVGLVAHRDGFRLIRQSRWNSDGLYRAGKRRTEPATGHCDSQRSVIDDRLSVLDDGSSLRDERSDNINGRRIVNVFRFLLNRIS